MSVEVTVHSVGTISRSGCAEDGNIASDHDKEETKRYPLTIILSTLALRDKTKANASDIFGHPDPAGEAEEVASVVDVVTTAALGKVGA